MPTKTELLDSIVFGLVYIIMILKQLPKLKASFLFSDALIFPGTETCTHFITLGYHYL